MAARADEPEGKDAAPQAPPRSAPDPDRAPSERRSASRAPAILATLIVVAIVGLSLWYLAQPQPLLVQGEADATRIDIAARVDGRVAKRPVERGDNVGSRASSLRDRQPGAADQASRGASGVSTSRTPISRTSWSERGPRISPNVRRRRKALRRN